MVGGAQRGAQAVGAVRSAARLVGRLPARQTMGVWLRQCARPTAHPLATPTVACGAPPAAVVVPAVVVAPAVTTAACDGTAGGGAVAAATT